MTVTPLQLAAIVSAGVPGLYPVAALPSADDAADFDSAIIIDSADQRWRVRSPRHPEASMRLEAEHVILQSFSAGLRARLPFQVPTIVGSVQVHNMRTFIYTHIPGTHYDIDELAAISSRALPQENNLATDIGKIIATIHVMPETIIDEANLPVYTADQLRTRRIAELDRAEALGRVPEALITRWREQMNNPAMWNFRARVIHGDLNEDNLALNHRKITEITGWSEVCVGDPAIDFAWLLACSDQRFTNTVIQTYAEQMPQRPDSALALRANLYAEFALAQWLIRGVELEDSSMIDEALLMLNALEEDLRAAGEIRDSQQTSRAGNRPGLHLSVVPPLAEDDEPTTVLKPVRSHKSSADSTDSSQSHVPIFPSPIPSPSDASEGSVRLD